MLRELPPPGVLMIADAVRRRVGEDVARRVAIEDVRPDDDAR